MASSTAGTGYDRLAVAGTVTLDNATLAATVGYAAAPGDRLFVLVNDGTDPVAGAGRFLGLPDGATVDFGDYTAQISYFGDLASLSLTGGNDVVLHNFQPVPEPAAVLAVAAAGLAGVAARRRLVAGAG